MKNQYTFVLTEISERLEVVVLCTSYLLRRNEVGMTHCCCTVYVVQYILLLYVVYPNQHSMAGLGKSQSVV